MLNIIDIADHQKGLNLSTLFNLNPKLNGVIIKATGGVYIYQESTFIPWAEWCIEHNKPFGFYHFLNDDYKNSSGKAEAEFFVNKTQKYFGKGIPCADYEGPAKQMGTKYLKEFLDTVYEMTGVKPFLYCSRGIANSNDMLSIADAGYRLWVAQYANYNPMYSFTDNPWKSGSIWPWKFETMRQYTSCMYLSGWKSRLDASLFYGSVDDWNFYAKGENKEAHIDGDDIDKIAREVISGMWGNGSDRIYKLTNAGYDYQKVQDRVNEILGVKPKKTGENINKIAKDVIAGKYGNGAIRITLLTLAGYDAKAVQDEVNKIIYNLK